MTDDRSAGPDAWERWIVGWHVAFWLLAGLAALWVARTTHLTAAGRAAGLGLVAVLAAAYLTLVVRSPGEARRTWRGPTYLTISVAVVGLGSALDPTMSMLLFILFPHVWMFGCSLAYSLGFAVLLAVAASTGILAHSGWSQQALRDLAPQLGLSLAFSLLLGVWISRIIDQSRDRGQLITELGATRDELAAAQRAQGALAERERMAREIHDTLAQGFTSIVMLAQAATARLPRDPDGAAERLATIEDVARDNLAEARALVAALAPVDLDGATLADAVRRTAARFARESGIEVSVDVSLDVPLDVPVELADGDPARGPAAAGALGRAQQVVVLRAVQEALANVRRHARAAHVMLRLRRDGDQTRLEVVDDGTGFSPEIACAGGGFGLDGMRGRVAAIGGELDVVSAPGAGTRLVVRVPAQVPAAGVEGVP